MTTCASCRHYLQDHGDLGQCLVYVPEAVIKGGFERKLMRPEEGTKCLCHGPKRSEECGSLSSQQLD